MKVKKFFIFLSVLIVIVFSIVCIKCVKDFTKKEQIILKLSEIHSEDYPTSLAVKKFSQLVEEKTAGRIKIEVFTNGRLYEDEISAIEALQSNELDFARVSLAPVAKLIPKLNVIQLPFQYHTVNHYYKVLYGAIGKYFLNSIENENVGLIGLCYYDSGARAFYLKKEIHNVDDLKGLKIRIQDSPIMQKLCSLFGATGVSGIPSSYVYDKLLQGVIDGAENNISTYQDMGDYQIANYYVRTNHIRIPDVLLMSDSIYEKLSIEDIELIKECAEETQKYQIQKWVEKESDSEKIVLSVKNTIVELSDEEIESFKEKVKPIYAEYSEKYEKFLTLIEELD